MKDIPDWLRFFVLLFALLCLTFAVARIYETIDRYERDRVETVKVLEKYLIESDGRLGELLERLRAMEREQIILPSSPGSEIFWPYPGDEPPTIWYIPENWGTTITIPAYETRYDSPRPE